MKKLCEHGRRKCQCRDCGGSSFCVHDRQKYTCKECKGTSICEHNRIRSECKECKGTSICEHNKKKSRCPVCNSSILCIHLKYKNECIDCDGPSICEHKKIKNRCLDCMGSYICEHKKLKSRCSICSKTYFCEHNRRKSRCIDCGGIDICIHKKQKTFCKICFPLHYLINIQRSNIQRVLKLSTLTKEKCTIEYLGCSVVYFENYIKTKMVDGMTIDNIHYDHIKPISKFDLKNKEEFMKCCHYTNFQPLLKIDNLCKSNKWTNDNDIFWKENICGKEYIPIYPTPSTVVSGVPSLFSTLKPYDFVKYG